MSEIEQRNRDFATLVEFILASAEHAPVKTRVPVYRALAILLGDTSAAKQLTALASELETLDSQFREFAFTLDFATAKKTSPAGDGEGKSK
jgi:hypothetical protein